tara:strand:- start:297 stop:947 length:651 start_codon:yes stop_codon:yes gene_type:complete
MKKSELKNYIRENIISTLSEDTDAEIEKTKELTSAVKDLEVAKKEAGIEEANISLSDLQDIGYDDGEYAFDKYFNKSILNNVPDTKAYKEGFIQAIIDSAGSLRLEGKEDKEPTDAELDSATKRLADRGALKNPRYTDGTSVKEDEDKEPTKSDIKKTKGLAKAKEELALLTREMKSLAKKYSKAEGEEKEKLVKTLKAKTKLKKELESILDKKKM